MTRDPRVLAAAWAAEGAKETRQRLETKPDTGLASAVANLRSHVSPEKRLRTGRRTQQAIDALLNLRNDVSLGLPAAALLDRIDDELFKLKRGTVK